MHYFFTLEFEGTKQEKGINNKNNSGSDGGDFDDNDDGDDGDECGDDGLLVVNFWRCDGDVYDDAAADYDGKGDYTYAYDKLVIVRMMIIAVEFNRHVDDSDFYDDGRWVRSAYLLVIVRTMMIEVGVDL